MQRPMFSAMEAQDRPEFYVVIRWAGRFERRVNRFVRREDAERWIAAEGENWLRQRLGQRGFPQTGDTSPSTMSANSDVGDRARAALTLAA